MEKIPLADITTKLRTKEDRVNFCRENGNNTITIIGFYLPVCAGYDLKFFLQFWGGQKKVNKILFILKLLNLGMVGGFSFKYFTKTNNLTKNHLIQLLNNDEELKLYLPDDISFTSIPRDLILSV